MSNEQHEQHEQHEQEPVPAPQPEVAPYSPSHPTEDLDMTLSDSGGGNFQNVLFAFIFKVPFRPKSELIEET